MRLHVNDQGLPVNFVGDNGKSMRWTSNAWALLIIEGGTRRRAVDVFVGAVIWWEQFFKEGETSKV